MTAEAFVKTNKSFPNFLIVVCSLLSLHVTRYSSESKLPLSFKGLWRWLIVYRHRLNSHTFWKLALFMSSGGKRRVRNFVWGTY